MRKIFRKLKSKRGESFVEILIAILIVALGSMLIATLYSTSMDLNLNASEQDDAYYGAVSDMEQMYDGSTSTEQKKAVITDEESKGSIKVTIDTYGDDTNAAYKRP